MAAKGISFAKALTWRVVASATTGLVSLFVTGSFVVAGSIMAIEFWVKIGAYYLHERAWESV